MLRVRQNLEADHIERPNALLGKLDAAVVVGITSARGITLSEDQVAALKFINTTRSPVLAITALAGTGKSTLAGIILEGYLREMRRGKRW